MGGGGGGGNKHDAWVSPSFPSRCCVCRVDCALVCSDRLCILAPKHDQVLRMLLARKTITMEQKMDILRRYDRGESRAAIRNAFNHPESTFRTIRKDREKIMAAVKAGAGSCATKVSSGQSNIIAKMEKMLVTWMDHRKRQGLNVAFDDTKNKAMECFSYLKEKETGPVPDFVPAWAGFRSLRCAMASIASSALERPRAPMRMQLLPTQRPSLRTGDTSPSRSSTSMKRGVVVSALTSHVRGAGFDSRPG